MRHPMLYRGSLLGVERDTIDRGALVFLLAALAAAGWVTLLAAL